jgi:hypothetical protein
VVFFHESHCQATDTRRRWPREVTLYKTKWVRRTATRVVTLVFSFFLFSICGLLHVLTPGGVGSGVDLVFFFFSFHHHSEWGRGTRHENDAATRRYYGYTPLSGLMTRPDGKPGLRSGEAKDKSSASKIQHGLVSLVNGCRLPDLVLHSNGSTGHCHPLPHHKKTEGCLRMYDIKNSVNPAERGGHGTK